MEGQYRSVQAHSPGNRYTRDRPLRRLATAMVLVFAGAMAAATATTAITAPPPAVSQLAPGTFLLAKAQIGDPRFAKTVIVITAHGRGGTTGLIINRPTSVTLHQLLPEVGALHGADDRLFLGGPVGLHSVFTLVRSHNRPADAVPVLAGTYVMSGLDGLETLLQAQDPETATRSYIGYTGWGRGQLEAEIDRGDWVVIDGDSSAIFDRDPATVWQELTRRYGGKWI